MNEELAILVSFRELDFLSDRSETMTLALMSRSSRPPYEQTRSSSNGTCPSGCHRGTRVSGTKVRPSVDAASHAA